uniref:Uncharacterized protein n=1 Tax=viral metagenome TaxID=1070528 RepID=A0A6C0BKB5_9ZZZZ
MGSTEGAEVAVLWSVSAVGAAAGTADRAGWLVADKKPRPSIAKALSTAHVVASGIVRGLVGGAETLFWPAAEVVLILTTVLLARVAPADALAIAELCRAAAGLAALYGRLVLRTEWIAAVIADFDGELIVHLAVADMLPITEAADTTTRRDQDAAVSLGAEEGVRGHFAAVFQSVITVKRIEISGPIPFNFTHIKIVRVNIEWPLRRSTRRLRRVL